MRALLILLATASAGFAPAAPRRVSVPHPGLLAAALAQARPGDTLSLADGEYADITLNLAGRGTEGRPITLRAGSPGKVRFVGRSSIELKGAWVTLEGFVFDRCTTGAITLRDTVHCRVTECAVLRCNPPDGARIHWLRVAGAAGRNNRIDHCYTEGKTGDGVVLVVDGDDGQMAQGTHIDHNHFKDVTRAVRNGQETIRVGASHFGQVEARAVVEHNLFQSCSGDAEIISSKSCGNTYRYNTFVECDGALVLRHGHRSVVEGNWFFGSGRPRTAGIRVHGSDHRVLNNYIESVGQWGIALPAGQSKFVPTGHEPTLNCVVAHNTLLDAGGPALLLGSDRGGGRDTPPTALLVNNLVLGTGGPLVAEPFPGALRWQANLLFGAPLGIAPRQGIRVAEPKLEKGAGGIRRPGAGSAALGAAVPLPFALGEDIHGRPRGAQPDIGAQQRSDAPQARGRLRPEDVGPAWMKAP